MTEGETLLNEPLKAKKKVSLRLSSESELKPAWPGVVAVIIVERSTNKNYY